MQRESEMIELPSVGNRVQRSENERKKLFSNYESPALTAELQARRAATREHRTVNVRRPIFTDTNETIGTNDICHCGVEN
jgi:hypothetical protein